MNLRRDRASLQRKRELDETGNTCCRLQMADIRLHRSDQQRRIRAATAP